MRSVQYVEIDFPFCSLTYGVAPCEAELGVTGTKKCFNTRRTCQDLENFDPAPLTLRFAEASSDLDPTIDAIPSLGGVSITPALLDPGVSMGMRESVSVSFSDHPHSDAGLDKYVADRAYDPFSQGTFWGKFRARNRSLKGQALRVIFGERGQSIDEMTTRHYIIEDLTGPSAGDTFSIIAKDALKLVDGDRAQAPAISNGELAAAINDSVGSLTLAPNGIGDIDYPAAGKAAIGGKEIVSFTRAGDVMTISRAQLGTEAAEHDEGEIVQLVLEYTSENPADIIHDLLTEFSNFDPLWIPLPAWQSEMETWIGRLYTAAIAEPTSVRELISELIEQVGLVLWYDVIDQQAYLTALRPVSQTASVYDLDRIAAKTFSATEQPKKRVSQAWTYFGLINPLARLDDPQNFTSAVATIDPDGSEAFYDEQPAIKKIFSRWIDSGNRPAASRLNELLLARYSTPPRRFAWAIGRADDAPRLGRGARIRHWQLQDDEGAQTTAPMQITSIVPNVERYTLTAEEMLFNAEDIGGQKIVIIDADAFDLNLRTLFDQFYTAPTSYDDILFVIESSVLIGGEFGGSNGAPTVRGRSIDVGDWPAGVSLTLHNFGDVRGRGGQGGRGSADLSRIDGAAGGTAIYTRYPIRIDNQGALYGGGGGGGANFQSESFAGDGGGGAGHRVGAPGFSILFPSEAGTIDSGGEGSGLAGDGGDPGQPGQNGAGSGTNGSGGGGGFAVDGDSFVTWTTVGTIVGAQVN